MNKQDEKLYQYITNHSADITKKWLALRKKQNGSIYSADIQEDVETLLKGQHTLTIKTVASVLLEDQTAFQENMGKWASIVARSRIEFETPVHEVLEALSKTREVFWSVMTDYMLQDREGVTKEMINRWSRVINRTFDKLNSEFTKQYYQLTNMRLIAQQDLINELGAPVIPIVDAIAVLPLIGEVDTFRAKEILNTIPEKCNEMQVSHLFIDLSGVYFLDTMVAHQIFQLTDTLNLLGIDTTISGLRPEVAQTAVQLGLDFSQIATHSTLKQALLKRGIKLKG